jgi:hypothetical protein
MNQLQQFALALASECEFSVQTLQRLMHQRHVRFEIDGFNGVDSADLRLS